jgi:hypothetical protein
MVSAFLVFFKVINLDSTAFLFSEKSKSNASNAFIMPLRQPLILPCLTAIYSLRRRQRRAMDSKEWAEYSG